MSKRILTTGQWLILLAILLMTSLGWSAVALWTEIAARSPQVGRTLLGVAYLLGVAGWAAITLRLWIAYQRGELGRRLNSLRFLRQKRTMMWASVAAPWVVLRLAGRLLVWAFDRLPMSPLAGMVLSAALASMLALALRALRQAEAINDAEPSAAAGRIAGWLTWILPGASMLAIVAYLVVAAFRLSYPFGLEWMEGGSVEQIRRLLAGQPLYTSPSMDFIPYIYTPLYFYVSALAAQITGVSFVPLRLVSIIASVGCLLLIFQIVRQETAGKVDGVLAAGLFAATYQAGASWLDLGRADTLALLLLLGAIYVLRFRKTRAGAAIAGVLLALSFLTKQTMLIAALPIMLYSLVSNWRRGICACGTAIVVAMLSCLALNVSSGGWFAYYIFGLPGQHRLYLPMLYGFWVADVWLPVGIAFTLAVAYLASMLLPVGVTGQANSDHRLNDLKICVIRVICGSNRNPASPAQVEAGSRFETGLFYLAVLIGLAGGSWAGKLNDGGFNNVLLLVYAAVSILFGLAIHRVRAWVDALPAGHRPVASMAVYGLCLIQLGGLVYNPLAHIPTQADVEAGRAVVEIIGSVEGDVFVPFHGYLAVDAGKPSYANGVALGELLGDFGGRELDSGSAVLEEIEQAIREQRFDAVILDSLPALDRTGLYQTILPLLDQYYERGRPLIDDDDAFWPLTGTRSRPDVIYYPKKHEE